MKNYLTEELSEDEKNEIIGIIKMTAKNFKYQKIRRKYIEPLFLDDLEIAYYDKYLFDSYNFKNYKDNKYPISEKEKTDIVNKLNILMDDLGLFELKRALTFNEKLVFFFSYMYKDIYTFKDVAFLLSITERTIYNRRESLKAKINFMEEGLQ